MTSKYRGDGYGKAARFESEFSDNLYLDDIYIHYSRLTGIHPLDLEAFCDTSREECLIIVTKCPKRPARYLHGKISPKRAWVKDKTDDVTATVTVEKNGRTYTFVSDYDLMCVYKYIGGGFEKVFFSGIDPKNPRSKFDDEATDLIRRIQKRLLSKLQHGAQDDFLNPEMHPNSKNNPKGKRLGGNPDNHKEVKDRFAAFIMGEVKYYTNIKQLKLFYENNNMSWPYDSEGWFLFSPGT